MQRRERPGASFLLLFTSTFLYYERKGWSYELRIYPYPQQMVPIPKLTKRMKNKKPKEHTHTPTPKYMN